MTGSLRIEAVSDPTPDLVEFLESVEFGGGGLRYRRKGLADLLQPVDTATWMLLRDQASVVRGSYALIETSSKLDGNPIRSVYRGLLAVDPVLRGGGYGKALVESAFGQLESDAGGEPLLSFGLIERNNTASLRLLRSLGASDVGTLESRLVYRQWPTLSDNVTSLSGNLLAEYESTLRDVSGLQLSSPGALPVLGLVRGDRVVAAARVSQSSIDLGAGGPIARALHRYAYSRIHAIGKRYNRRAFSWLSIHDPLVLPGEEKAWREFVSGVLALHDQHMALFTLDPKSATRKRLHDAAVFGRFSEATRQELCVLANGWNLAPDWDERIRAAPVTGGPVL